ncbi:conserved hypothetical protein [Desulfamplus magnetovallimortis]|uniref:Thiamine pyrimidine synthase n=1 Tax=Desulfamplus magnetovallimortis TaxID=1246637 RepID=A0A1W1HAI1_9BACT|nr:ABC transporter substrate-binding protein [Desulfamplus magnetovallimortis]SLM29491.1 conserved hypothetical protein [Desulfamplus magnetovallimortis]
MKLTASTTHLPIDKNHDSRNQKPFFFTVPILLLIFFGITITIPKPMHAEKNNINYRLKWLFNASVAGDIYADEKGYFRAEGIDVTVKEGSPEKNAINELELGYADFGVASADQVIRAINKGADVYVIAQLFQVNPMQWIYRKNSDGTKEFEIKTLQDLKGRHIGITFGGNDETIMNTIFTLGGIKKREVRITGVRFDFTPFLRKKVEIWPVYRNSQGVILEDKLYREGESVGFFNPSDFGVNFVANSVITSGKMLQQHPETVKKFLNALIEGWDAAMNPENEAITLELVKEKDKSSSSDIIKKQIFETRKLVKPTESWETGKINVDAWKQTEAIMLKEKQIEEPVNIEKFLK